MENKALENVINGLIGLKAYAVDELKEPQNMYFSLQVTSGLDSMINKLAHIAGLNVQPATARIKFLPITKEFMGGELDAPVAVLASDLEPTQTEEEIYAAKVEALYNSFTTRETADLIDSHTLPEDQLVLRGVAKKAGVKDYANAPIDINFLAEIAAGITTKKGQAQQMDDYEKMLERERILNLGDSRTAIDQGSDLNANQDQAIIENNNVHGNFTEPSTEKTDKLGNNKGKAGSKTTTTNK